MAGMFRGGHMRPTFDTAVEFVSVNQSATDKSGGYGSPITVRGEWGAPEVMTEMTVADRDAFVPTGDSGVQATNIGMFVWYTDGDTQRLMFQGNNINTNAYYKDRTNGGAWQDWVNVDASDINASANRSRNPIPVPIFIVTTARNTPFIPRPRRVAILIDDATGQSLYYCNDEIGRCKHYRRAIDDGLGPASRTYYADVKDIAGSERVIGDQSVAVRTKSLVFAHATLKPLLDAEGSIAKDWKVRIGGRDMDITGVMDGWVPNRYTRLTVEDRT